MKTRNTKKMILASLFAALTAVLSQIAVPIGPVPFNLATFSVFCAGAFLGPHYGFFSMVIYVLLGAVGVPVFALFKGGLNTLTGPSGGYITGYIFAAWAIGFIIERFGSKKIYYYLSMLVGSIIYFSMGTVWFMFITHTSMLEALSLCVLPFIPGDVLKLIVAATLACNLNPILRQSYSSYNGN